MKEKNYSLYYLILSTISIFLLSMLVFLNHSNKNILIINDKLIIGFTFIACCIFGISLTKYPGWIKRLTESSEYRIDKKQIRYKKKYLGHHPDCKEFKNHMFRFKNKIYCSGCFGLFSGSLISIVIMIFYISISSEKSIIFYRFLFLIGILIIIISYLEIIFLIRNSVIHIISNISLIISFLIITISIFELLENIIYGLITILLSFLWIDTRIYLSKWNHKKICKRCIRDCKMY